MFALFHLFFITPSFALPTFSKVEKIVKKIEEVEEFESDCQNLKKLKN